MARSNKRWLSFAGVRSDALGAYPVDAPRSCAPARRAVAHSVAGRSGCLYISDNSLSEFDIACTLRMPASRLRAVKAWLQGAGELRFSHESDALYDARILKNVEFRQLLCGDDPIWECAVSFTCQPHPALYPAAGEAEFHESGGVLTSPQGCFGLPRVSITGSGDFTLTVGGDTLLFTGVEGGVIVDSVLGDALTADGANLANERFTGPLPALAPGENVISWSIGEGGGSVERVRILPRWRWL